ncbi:MAG: phosphatidate cytidylyltransferase [Candidatus Omnitrophica bacterium]|nr:phosphatidate cytidylyltransferase [Candidatus Omnitrophota bacterium]
MRGITDPILSSLSLAGLMIFCVLLLSSALIEFLSRHIISFNITELKDRVRAWWIMAFFFFAAVVVNRSITIIFFALLSFMVFKEFVTILDTRRADHRALFWAFLCIPAQYYFVSIGWYGMFIIFIPVYMFLFIPIRLVLTEEPKGFLSSTSAIQWGLMAFVFGLSHLAFLSKMPAINSGRVNGATLLLFLVIATEMNDVFQYLWGKAVGRRKIIPGVSPKKTSEGFWGGVITTTLCSLFLRFLTPFNVEETLFFGFIIGVLGFFGDVVMSAIKRDVGIKDFSNFIPGHGGALDRADSLCYTAPIFFHLVRYFYY